MQTPIAIIGLGCRFPRADGPDSFWSLLKQGEDALGEVPGGRWRVEDFFAPESPQRGRSYSPRGGFIADGDCYDAGLFGIQAQEAEQVDPQQGLSLEVAWQGLEHAGIAPDSLGGTETGVFWGVSTRDYDRRVANQWDMLDVRTSTGACGAIVANRISFSLGLCGPSVAVDAACASSLVAVHLACQSLAAGECELAIAGGVHLILSPANAIAFSQGKLLARDGRCKSFSSKADGYVFGEGGGCVVLKPLDAAVRDGDFIWAVVRGSATNHNGLSNGLSAPLGRAQQRVVRRALAAGGVAPSALGYVEAHASGTMLGDTIEVNALRASLGEGRRADQRCLLGSVKSNIGHLEAAAGIAGLLKTVLALHHGQIPATLHGDPVSPHLRLAGTAFSIATQPEPWPAGEGPRFAGVSSLSFGGTNAHVVLGEAPGPVTAAAPGDDGEALLLPLSAQSPEALTALARTHLAFFRSLAETPDAQAQARFVQACVTLATGRSQLPHRIVLRARTAGEAVRALEALLQGAPDAALVQPRAGQAHARAFHLMLSSPAAGEGSSASWPSAWTWGAALAERAAELVRRELPLAFADRRPEAERLLGLVAVLARGGAVADTVAGADAVGDQVARLASVHLGELLGAGAESSVAPPSYVSSEELAGPDAKRSAFTLRLGEDALEASSALASLFVQGARLDWNALYSHLPRTRMPLATYAFQRRRHHSFTPSSQQAPAARTA
ncbi:malonyl CoA-acyl carrier protein transacylase [Corallococcus coralloides DSM 2259]|uniref:Malonyl CoA-acyl carrier protein transacylase n=1 Tax=Corallococcus coralloides (strain ATCC 25202 / DSM 2259 / NBRC 100086 / M2) TaxID=1144275 RepID=H8MRD2_CORCM|nr:polyketide synthase [Corallococcus coralloides]AFE09962.1 malonyl CoA-acyl carrier protein transacylase [Corallococcus coralloides DSM 2259]